MKKILIVLGTILAVTAGKVITAESKVSIMKEEQSQSDEIATGREQKSEEIDLKQSMLYYYLLQIIENNNGTKTCTFCEYLLLSFVYSVNINDTITTPEEVKEFFGNMCTKLPSPFEDECKEFIGIYGDDIVAVIFHGMYPSQVCPMAGVCSSEASLNIWNEASKFIKEEDTPICPLCWLVLLQIYNVFNKTETFIEAELYKVCNHFPHVLTDKCTDFVKLYAKKLAVIFANLSPLEACIHLHLCDPDPKRNNIAEKDGEILTSEILEYPSHIDQPTNILNNSACIFCEFAMQSIAKEIGNSKMRDWIARLVRGVCSHLRKTVAKYCFEFVDDYVDAIINMLSEVVSRPKESCTILGLC